MLWFSEPLLLEAIQKKFGQDEDGFDSDEFAMAIKKIHSKLKTPWQEAKTRATMGGKITEVGIKLLYGIGNLLVPKTESRRTRPKIDPLAVFIY